MKNLILFTLITLSVACTGPEKPKKIEKNWLGKAVQFDRIKESVLTYNMLDSTREKVGSMVFGFYFKDGVLIARDTSQFDDGSVYETAEFVFDTTEFNIKSVAIDMQLGPTSLDLDFEKNNERISGSYIIRRDTSKMEKSIDSVFTHDVFREELYMLMHTLDYTESDSLTFNVFVPTGMNVASASIYYEGEETVTTPLGSFLCDVIWLKSDGKMPTNKIWIAKEEPRKLVKFYVPGPELSIELVSVRSSIGD